MKFLRIGAAGRERPAIIDEEGITRDVSSIVADIDRAAIGEGLEAKFKNVNLAELPSLPADARIGAPIADVRNFICVGLNYRDHAVEANLPIPNEPILFNKAPSSIVGPNDPIVVPEGASKVDWEVELGIVIGKSCSPSKPFHAEEVILGFTLCNDVSERSWQMDRGGSWMKGKSAPSFGPMGPWLVTKDELSLEGGLPIWLTVNGVSKQCSSTSEMIFSCEQIVRYIASFMALEPGDVIATGTPAGVGFGFIPQQYLQLGDVVELGIEGLGTQKQLVTN